MYVITTLGLTGGPKVYKVSPPNGTEKLVLLFPDMETAARQATKLVNQEPEDSEILFIVTPQVAYERLVTEDTFASPEGKARATDYVSYEPNMILT